MKRAFLALLALPALFASAQQPDFRVRLFSVHDTHKIQIEPIRSVTISLCSGCKAAPMTEPVVLTGLRNSVQLASRSLPRVFIDGRVRIQSADGLSQAYELPLEIASRDDSLIVVARMPLEEYALQAVQGESAGDMPREALKAMAVVARSFATSMRGRHKELGLDLCDSTHCQNLRSEISPAVRAAVAETRGQVLWSAGSPALAFHSKDCGGQSAAVSEVWPDIKASYLAARKDDYCIRATRSWTSTFTDQQITQALRESGVQLPPRWSHLAISKRTESGRALLLHFVSDSGGTSARVSSSTLRSALGRTFGWQSLKSDLYDIDQQRERFIFTGRGVGHGVGLCQTGASEMANAGKTYRQILEFYYPGTQVGVSAKGIPWKSQSLNNIELRAVDDATLESIRGTAKDALRAAELATGITAERRFEIRIYPSTAMFRDATGEPGWVAASTRGDVIEMQPLNVLGKAGGAGALLRHEFVHSLLENVADPATPLWFREGLADFLTDSHRQILKCTMTTTEVDSALRARRSQKEMQLAYDSAAYSTRLLARRYGTQQLLQWLRHGLPRSILADLDARCNQVSQHSSD